jgi:hypothetical protein
MQNLKTLLPALSMDQVRTACPMAFSESPSNDVSNRYVFMNTETIIKDMESLGWVVVSAKQRKAQKGVSTRFSPHMIIFQNPDLQIKSEDERLAISAILINSHDGTQPVEFRMGIFRAACSNGLVVVENEFNSFKIRHRGYSFEELQKGMRTFLDNIPSQVDVINQMSERILTEEEQMDIALKALLIRTGVSDQTVEAPSYSEETLKEVLKPRRLLDNGDNLWLVLNRIQESVTHGGFRVETELGKKRKLSPVKSFEKDFDLNDKLFSVAMEYLAN